jgi:hypothetical protein
VHFIGVAADQRRAAPLDLVVLLINGKPMFWAAPNIVRHETAQRLSVAPDILLGYRASVPASVAVTGAGEKELEVYGLSFADGIAWRGSISARAKCNWREIQLLQGNESYETDRAAACKD